MIFTYQSRIPISAEEDALLTAYAQLYGKVERTLFADIQAGGNPGKLKSSYLRRFNITARQYNAVAINLKGRIGSVSGLRDIHISELEKKIAKAEKTIRKLEKKAPGSNKLHQKKRRLEKLKHRLRALQADHDSGTVRICFGGRKLFRAQFHLEENGYDSIDQWREDWQRARSSGFFVIGSKDETAGCQGCVASLQDDHSFHLRLRLPNAIGKYAVLQGVRFAYGQEVIEKALLTGTAISYRFKQDDKGWRVFVSIEYQAPETITSRMAGAVGVDINADCLAVSEIDRFGNLTDTEVAGCITYGKSSSQAKAVVGDAVKQIVARACKSGKPVVIEKLDFSKRKSELEGGPASGSRMLSSFAYSQIQQTLGAACYRAGVEVISVNPAYTSTIGAVNHAQRFGISIHQGAALAIARRALGFSERPIVKTGIVPAFTGDHVTFLLPERNRRKHVWSFWSAVRKNLKTAHAAHIRSGQPPAPLRQATPASGAIWVLPVKSRHVNRQQNCSAGVMDDIPY